MNKFEYRCFSLGIFLILVLGTFLSPEKVSAREYCEFLGNPTITVNIAGQTFSSDGSITLSPGAYSFNVYTYAEPSSTNGISFPGGYFEYTGPNRNGRGYTTDGNSGTIIVWITQECISSGPSGLTEPPQAFLYLTINFTTPPPSPPPPPPSSGDIYVVSQDDSGNPLASNWVISGPNYFYDSGTSASHLGVPVGDYSLSASILSGYGSPQILPSQGQSLSGGNTITYTIIYPRLLPGPFTLNPTSCQSSNTIPLTWSSSANASQYEIYEKRGAGNWSLLITTASTFYNATGRPYDTDLYYYVMAVNSQGTRQSDPNGGIYGGNCPSAPPPPPPPGGYPPPVCSPSSQTVQAGNSASFSASGGNGDFIWSAPSGSPSSGVGISFVTSYGSPAGYTVTLSSAGQSTNCSVTVSSSAPPPGQNRVWVDVPSCASVEYFATINWSNINSDPTYGYFIDVTTDSSFNTLWNTRVFYSPGMTSGSVNTNTSGFGCDSDNFCPGTPSGESLPLKAGKTYYARVWAGSHYPNSGPISFTVPSCATPTPAPTKPVWVGQPACVASTASYTVGIDWEGTPNTNFGTYIDIDEDPGGASWDDTNLYDWWNKNIYPLGGTYTNSSNFDGFYPSTSSRLTLRPEKTYYSRAYTGYPEWGVHSTTSEPLMVPACTLTGTLVPNPNFGTSPLSSTLTATVTGGTATGNVTYRFDCNNDGTYETPTIGPTSSTTATFGCTYQASAYTKYHSRVNISRKDPLGNDVVEDIISDPIVVIPPPTVSLSPTPTSVAYGGSSTLSWGSTGAYSCTASGDWPTNGTKPLSGSEIVGPLNTVKTYSYTLTCYNLAGVSATKTVSVTVSQPPTPSCSLSYSGPNEYNSTGNLSWSSSGAVESCQASSTAGDFSGQKAPTGSESKGPITSTRTYSMSCVGPTGIRGESCFRTVTLPTQSADITCSPPTVSYNGQATVTWESTNAGSCSVTKNGSGWASGTSGSQSTGNVTSLQTYNLDCSRNGPTIDDSCSVYVIPTADIKANGSDGPIGPIPYNTTVNITWCGSGATTCANATSCSVTDLPSGTSGNYNPRLTSDKTYTLTCSGEGNTNNSDPVTVRVGAPPVMNYFRCNGVNTDGTCTVNYGGTAAITWSSSNTTGCSLIAKNPDGSIIYDQFRSDVTGSQNDTGIVANRNYEMVCWGDGAQAPRLPLPLHVVVPAPEADIKCDNSDGPCIVEWNGSPLIEWCGNNAHACLNAGSCSVTKNGSGWASGTSGSQGTGVQAPGIYIYSLTCLGNGSTSDPTPAQVTVNEPIPDDPTNVIVTPPDYCMSGPAATIGWTYSDPSGSPQSAYEVQMDEQGSFQDPEYQTGKVISGSNSNFTGQGILQFNKNYKTRVRVWNSYDQVSGWTVMSGNFDTPPYAYPQTDFYWTANGIQNNPSPPLNKPVTFTDTTVFQGNPNGRKWSWSFGETPPTTSTLQNPSKTYSAEGSYYVTLTATDNANQSCTKTKGPLILQKPIPKIREIAPK